MSEPSSARSRWSDGISLEGIPYADQPKVIVAVQCYRKNPDFPDYSIPLAIEHCDITDWLQANPCEQNKILDQVFEALNGSDDLDELGDPDELDDAVSGDHLVGLDDPGLPAGDDGTDIHLLSAYVRYLKECRDRDFIPFSDEAGHAERIGNLRREALDSAHGDVLSALDRYTVLVRENAAADERCTLFSSAQSEQHRQLWEKAQPLVARIYPPKKVSTP